MKKIIFLLVIAFANNLSAQEKYTRKDSLQGGLRFERTCYDVLHYTLDIKIDPTRKSIAGYNEINFKVVEATRKIQVDLFANMNIDSIMWNGKKLNYKREFNAVFIDFPTILKASDKN